MTEDATRPKPAVLLCEAYGPLREGLELALGQHYHVVSTKSLQAVPALLEQTPDAVLLIDVDHQSQPYAILQELRTRGTRTPILLLSREFTLEHQTAATQRIGNVNFLTKPFELALLHEKLQLLSGAGSPIRRRIVRIAHRSSP